VVTSAVIGLCLLIKRHYVETRKNLAQADAVYAGDPELTSFDAPLSIDPSQPTAIVLVGRHRGVSMHALVWIQRLFPHYKNFIFLAVGGGRRTKLRRAGAAAVAAGEDRNFAALLCCLL
jgi:hypothetical protein